MGIYDNTFADRENGMENVFSVGDFNLSGFEIIIGNSSRGNHFLLQTLQSPVTLHGGRADDRFTTSIAHADKMYGYGGDDFFNVSPNDIAIGGYGSDTFDLSATSHNVSTSFIDGGHGRDTLDLSFGWTVDLVDGTADSPFSGSQDTYHFASIENVIVYAWRGYETSIEGNSEGNHLSVNPNFSDGSVGVYFDGGSGADTLIGSAGMDTLLGREGDDWISGGSGTDRLEGGSGNDTLDGGEGSDSLTGGLGDDHLIAGLGAEHLDGSPGGSDTLDYSNATSAVHVRLFNNTVFSGDAVAAGDTIVNFENAITGEGGDLISGNHLNNILIGNGGKDTIFGSDGSDVLRGGDGSDVLRGGDGADYLDGGRGADGIRGGLGDDRLIGATGNDTMNGEDGADTLIGGLGDDRLIGNTGAEVLDGSPGGSDTLDYSAATGSMTLRIWNNTVSGDLIANGDTIRNFENAETGSGNDLLAGNFQNNVLTGNGGNDSVYGYGGNDVLEGGEGTDVIRGGIGNDTISGGPGLDYLSGETGADVFMFGSAAEAGMGALRDQIMDFVARVDLIDVSGMAPGAIGFRGTAGFTSTGNAELRLIETTTGSTIVQFDVDGNGTTDAELRVADVTGLMAGDFVLL
jgi:Ca2+-binding RTX toxin-like protein